MHPRPPRHRNPGGGCHSRYWTPVGQPRMPPPTPGPRRQPTWTPGQRHPTSTPGGCRHSTARRPTGGRAQTHQAPPAPATGLPRRCAARGQHHPPPPTKPRATRPAFAKTPRGPLFQSVEAWSGCCPRCALDFPVAALHPGWCRVLAMQNARPSVVAEGRGPRGRRSLPGHRRRYRRRYRPRRCERPHRSRRPQRPPPPTRHCRSADRVTGGSAQLSTALVAGGPTRQAGGGRAATAPQRPTPTVVAVRATPVAPLPAARALAGVVPPADSTSASRRRRCPWTMTTGGGLTRGAVRPARRAPPSSTTSAGPSSARRPWRPWGRAGGKTGSLGCTDACGRRG